MAEKKQLSEFARRAAQRLKDKQVSVKFDMYIPSLGQNITLRSLRDDEFLEIYESEESGRRQDKMLLYTAAVEPDLREVATELREAGEIAEYPDVVDMFTLAEQKEIASAIMEKSGITGGEKARVVEKVAAETKN